LESFILISLYDTSLNRAAIVTTCYSVFIQKLCVYSWYNGTVVLNFNCLSWRWPIHYALAVHCFSWYIFRKTSLY